MSRWLFPLILLDILLFSCNVPKHTPSDADTPLADKEALATADDAAAEPDVDDVSGSDEPVDIESTDMTYEEDPADDSSDESIEDPDSPFIPMDHIPDFDDAPDMVDAIEDLLEAYCYRFQRCDPTLFDQLFRGEIAVCLDKMNIACQPPSIEEAKACTAEMNTFSCGAAMPHCDTMCP